MNTEGLGKCRRLPNSLFQCSITPMTFIANMLPYVQILLSILLIAAVLLQARGSSVGGAFGGDNMGTTFYTRRGAERVLFRSTIVIGILFALTAFANLYL